MPDRWHSYGWKNPVKKKRLKNRRAVLAPPALCATMKVALLGCMALLALIASAEEPEDWVAPKDNLAVGMRRAMEAERARGEGRRIGNPHTYGNLCVFGCLTTVIPAPLCTS